ncbi:MAG: 30S ribosomal protein S3 [Dehalococcoidales bacterium]|nr:30S ribosomal protein S3 [Dehalococcoidales bacterium]
MGHKVHPTGFRLGVIRDWQAKWYADRHYMEYLQEDLALRKVVASMYPEAGVSLVEIDRQANNVSMTIHTARPGILIGRGGQRVDEMRGRLETLIGKKVQLNIREVPQPELDAQLVARNVCDQIERRIAYRRTLKQTLLRSMQAGARGMRISIAGRLDGAEIARRVTMHEGQVPLHTLRADIDYGFSEARTNMGRIGVKVWLYKGDILPAPREVELEEVITEPVAVPGAAAEPAAKVVVKEAPAEAVAEVVIEEAPAEAVAEAKAQPTKRKRATAAAVVEETTVEAVIETVVEETPAEAVAEAKAQPTKRKRATAAASAETGAKASTRAAPKARAKAKDTSTTEKPAPESEDAASADAEAIAKPRPKRRTKAASDTKAEVKKPKKTAKEPVAEAETTPEASENQGEGDAST